MSTAHRRPRVGRRLAVLLAAASVAVAAALTTGSAAIFTSASGNGLSTVSAGDWVPPTVNLTSPGSSVSGEVTLTAQATDPGGTGVTQVVIQHRPAGSTAWTSTCPTPTAPYSCAWNTTTVSDGVYELRAVATDHVGLTSTSAVVTTTVGNAASRITLDPLSSPLKGTVTVSATVSPYPVAFSVRFEYRPEGTGSWTTACTTVGVVGVKPSCRWDTTKAGNGPHDVRAVLNPLLGSEVASPTVRVVLAGGSGAQAFSLQTLSAPVPQTAPQPSTPSPEPTRPAAPAPAPAPAPPGRATDPTVPVGPLGLDDPGTDLVGAVPLTATVAPGVEAGPIAFLARTAGEPDAEWVEVCVAETVPWTCIWETNAWLPGGYDLQAVASVPGGDPIVSAELLDRRVVALPTDADGGR